MTRTLSLLISVFSLFLATSAQAEKATNPTIWADVPDMSMMRVGDTYYMSSTTMHMSPGLPIMKSKDLVNWDLVGYAYDRLVENDAMNLANGQNCYGRGSWASSLRYHNGTYYASTFSATSGKTQVYSTQDIEKGPWKAVSFEPVLHDNSLFFDDDGRVYMLYGGGTIRIRELNSDASGLKPGGVDQVLIENVSLLFGADEVGGLGAEGSQLFKVNGKYYLFNIASPKSRWSRTVLIHRADKITGPYEGRIALEDRHIAQGGLIDTPDGTWYAYLFGDRGAVGRIPYLVPVTWEGGWPVLGVDGKAPETLAIEDNRRGLGNLVASDEFERAPGEPRLPLAWQWNHNPDNEHWAVLEQPGRLRITTGRVDTDVLSARNMLTQRTFGPVSSTSTSVNLNAMKDGDVAGLIALQKKYGYVGVKQEGEKKTIVMVSAQSDASEEIEAVPCEQETAYFKIECDFRDQTDKANFFYSLDGKDWKKIGNTLQMAYTLPHFMGYRFGLFNWATQTAGGHVDFDFYRISDRIGGGEVVEPRIPDFGPIELGPDDKPAFPEPPAGFDVARDGIPHGRLEMIRYDSKTVGTRRQMLVYTPPGYSPQNKYPVLYLLHGIGGDEKEWQWFAHPEILLDNLIADDKAVPMIVVMPNGRAQKNDRAEGNVFAAAPAFAVFERDLLDDVIPAIEARYSTQADRTHRALAGLSMGGGQSLNFGLGNLDTFAWVGGFSSAPNTKPPAELVPDAEAAKRQLKLLFLSCGNRDGLIHISQGVHAYLKEKGVPHIWHVDGNAHDPTHWKGSLYHFAPLIFR